MSDDYKVTLQLK